MSGAFATPEEAALAEWRAHAQAHAHIVSVHYVNDDEAVVVTDTVPSHPMRNYCSRTPDGWVFCGDNN